MRAAVRHPAHLCAQARKVPLSSLPTALSVVQEHGAPHCPGWLWKEARQRQPETPGQGRSSPLASRLHPGERSVPTAASSPCTAQPWPGLYRPSNATRSPLLKYLMYT